MRNLTLTVTALVCLFFSEKVHAGNIAVSQLGLSCDDAVNALQDQYSNGSNAYSADQYDTSQYPTLPAAKAGCQARGAASPRVSTFDSIPRDLLQPDPRYTFDPSINTVCSYQDVGLTRTWFVTGNVPFNCYADSSAVPAGDGCCGGTCCE